MDNLYFVNLVLSDSIRNHISIRKYKIYKETERRIYYYDIFDEDSTEEDVKYIDKDRLENILITNRGDNTMMSSIWCREENLQDAKNTVGKELKKVLLKRISNINNCYEEVKVRSTIKI